MPAYARSSTRLRRRLGDSAVGLWKHPEPTQPGIGAGWNERTLYSFSIGKDLGVFGTTNRLDPTILDGAGREGVLFVNERVTVTLPASGRDRLVTWPREPAPRARAWSRASAGAQPRAL